MTELDYQAIKEVIRLLPEYSKTLDFDIINTAYSNVLERMRRAHSEITPAPRSAHRADEVY